MTGGQLAYETFVAEVRRRKCRAAPWREIEEDEKLAWEAVASAIAEEMAAAARDVMFGAVRKRLGME